MPKITIDGRTIEAEAGMTVIQAAHEAGITIPYYCYHPGLVPDGNCRVCLVEVEKAPKLMIACKTPVTDGMVVHTDTERVREARRSVLEFLLINHPIDCPVCDQAGECKLQDYYYDYDLADSRFKEAKNHKPKVEIFGEHVAFDGERCILCARCVRFTSHVTETYELTIQNRGDRAVIALAEGKRLDNPYSLNTVDICPVGALTSRDFRFQKRVWFLDEHPSVCPGCARGCAVWLDADPRENKVYRIRPRKNLLVNGYWMCDHGRFLYREIEHHRLREHRLAGRPVPVEEALAATVELLQATPPERIGVLVSAAATLEELASAARLLTALGVERVALGRDRIPAPGEVVEDDLLIEADKNPNTAGARWLLDLPADGGLSELTTALRAGEVDLLLLWGRGAGRVLGEAVSAAARTIRLTTHDEDLGFQPDVELAGRVWAEKRGSFLNVDGVVTPFRPAVAAPPQTRDELALLAALGREAAGIELPAEVEGAWALVAERHPELAGLTFAELERRRAVRLGVLEVA